MRLQSSIVLLGVLLSVPAAAQRRSDLAQPLPPAPPPALAAAIDTLPDADTTVFRRRPPPQSRLAVRTLLGGVGWAGGVFAGVLAGPGILGDDCGVCDDPGLEEALLGAFVMGSLGAGFLAGAPNLGAKCGFGERFLRGAAGGALGTLAGLALSGDPDNAGAVLIVPGSVGLGAALFADC